MRVFLLFAFLSLVHGYNYYMLAMQNWCESDYQIHGLWPQYNSTNWPENCGGPAYQEITNQTLLDEMNAEWSNCNQPPSSLWSHEWTKHMTCILQQYPGVYTQTTLFQKVLDLFKITKVADYCFNGVSDCYNCFTLDWKQFSCP